MFSKLLIGFGLMALCVMIHAIGVTSAVRWLRYPMTAAHHFWLGTWLFIRLAGWIIVLHLIEITTWAFYYVWKDAMADLPSALYFSAVTYTTTGYGDLGTAARVAIGRSNRGANWHSDVWMVDRLLPRGCEPDGPGGSKPW